MLRRYAIVLCITFLAACNTNSSTKSPVEVVTIDTPMLNNIKSSADTMHTTALAGGNQWYIEHYWNNTDSTKTEVMYDSDKLIKSIVKKKRNVPIYTGTYYPNGQLRSTVITDATTIDSIEVKHYYEDGRISAHGYLDNGVHVGEWKYYDTAGYMKLIETYDQFGKLEKEQPISFKRD